MKKPVIQGLNGSALTICHRFSRLFTNRNENAEVHFVFGANNFHDDDECDQEVPLAGDSGEKAKGSVAPIVVYECPRQLEVDKLDAYKSQYQAQLFC